MKRMMSIAMTALAIGAPNVTAVHAQDNPRAVAPAPSSAIATGIAGGMLDVHVEIAFDPSIKSALTQRVAKDEAAGIWRSYGVNLHWNASETDGGSAAVCLEVIVERSRLQGSVRPVLAQTTIASDDLVRGPIRVSFDTVEALLSQRTAEFPGPYEFMVGAALGRVLAHELGHVLLGSPGYHDREGLMRASFAVDDLVRPERARFQLSVFSVARLRRRIAALSADARR